MQSILAELAKPNVVEAIAAAREAAGADVGLIMQEVVPIFYEVGHTPRKPSRASLESASASTEPNSDMHASDAV